MKTMFIAFAASLVIAVLADVALEYSGWSAADRQTSSAVRLGE